MRMAKRENGGLDVRRAPGVRVVEMRKEKCKGHVDSYTCGVLDLPILTLLLRAERKLLMLTKESLLHLINPVDRTPKFYLRPLLQSFPAHEPAHPSSFDARSHSNLLGGTQRTESGYKEDLGSCLMLKAVGGA